MKYAYMVKKSLKTGDWDLCPKGKGANWTLGFMRGAHPREIKKFEIPAYMRKKLIDIKNLLVVKEEIKL